MGRSKCWSNAVRHTLVVFLILLLALAAAGCGGQEREPADSSQQLEPGSAGEFILATTTSTRDSGLLDVLVPEFEGATGYRVKVVAVGTGKALEMAENGDADAILVHAPDAEKPLVDAGLVTNYQLVMHNDFVIVGPASDPAGIQEMGKAVAAFGQIASAAADNPDAVFVSRGDDSGTHKMELGLWEAVGVDPAGSTWYPETGQGMGETLMVANQKLGYTLTDRATYLHNQRNLDLEILVEGDGVLLNIYHAAQVNPEKFPDKAIQAEAAKAFVDFLVAPETQAVIAGYGVNEFGQPLFFPDAGKSMEELAE